MQQAVGGSVLSLEKSFTDIDQCSEDLPIEVSRKGQGEVVIRVPDLSEIVAPVPDDDGSLDPEERLLETRRPECTGGSTCLRRGSLTSPAQLPGPTYEEREEELEMIQST